MGVLGASHEPAVKVYATSHYEHYVNEEYFTQFFVESPLAQVAPAATAAGAVIASLGLFLSAHSLQVLVVS